MCGWTRLGITIRETPQRIYDALSDHVRRRNVISRMLEAWVGGTFAAVLVGAKWWSLLAGLIAIPVEFVFYEYIAEPFGWTGHYWERGPRQDESFERW